MRNAAYFAVCMRQDYVYKGGAAHLIPPEEAGGAGTVSLSLDTGAASEKRIQKTLRMLTKDLPRREEVLAAIHRMRRINFP